MLVSQEVKDALKVHGFNFVEVTAVAPNVRSAVFSSSHSMEKVQGRDAEVYQMSIDPLGYNLSPDQFGNLVFWYYGGDVCLAIVPKVS